MGVQTAAYHEATEPQEPMHLQSVNVAGRRIWSTRERCRPTRAIAAVPASPEPTNASRPTPLASPKKNTARSTSCQAGGVGDGTVVVWWWWELRPVAVVGLLHPEQIGMSKALGHWRVGPAPQAFLGTARNDPS